MSDSSEKKQHNYVNTQQDALEEKKAAAARKEKFAKEAKDNCIHTIFNPKANPNKSQRDEAIKFLKLIWKNVLKEEIKFRTIKKLAVERKLGAVNGAMEALLGMGFKVTDNGRKLFMSLDTPLSNGESIYQQLLQKEKEDPPSKSGTWRGNWVIKNFIALGSKEEAKNYDGLKANGITHILNVADNVDCFYKKKNEFTYLQLKVSDFGRDEGISRVFPKAIEFINKVEKENGRVLIHCFAGMNRSVSCTVAYIMANDEKTLKQAWRIVKDARPISSPFNDNRNQLIEYEKTYKKIRTSTMSLKDFDH